MEECGSLAAPRTHVSNLAALCMLDAGGEERFKVNERRNVLSAWQLRRRPKLLSADALLLQRAWVASSDALKYCENNTDKTNTGIQKGEKRPEVPAGVGVPSLAAQASARCRLGLTRRLGAARQEHVPIFGFWEMK